MPYIVPGEFSRSAVYRYEDNGKYYRMPFCMSGYDRFSGGCIPVSETSRLLLLGDYMARSNSGIWTDSGSTSFFALYWSMMEGILSIALRKLRAAANGSAIARCPLL